jgi:hypothetical protein
MYYETQVELEGRALRLRPLANLRLTAAEKETLLIRLLEGVEADVVVETGEEAVEVTLRASAQVYVPAGVPVQVTEASGNLHVGDLPNSLTVDEARGNLNLAEVDAAVVVGQVHGNLRAAEVGSLRVSGAAYGSLKVSECATVDVEYVHGEAKLVEVRQDVRLGGTAGNLLAKEIGGSLEAGDVKGNATLAEIGGAVRLDGIGGNLAAKELHGELRAGQVKGNATLAEVHGAVGIEEIRGNLSAKELASGLVVDAVRGNLSLAGPWAPGQEYRISAHGSAVVAVEPSASAQFRVKTSGHLVTSVPLEPDPEDGGWQVGSMGSGEARVEIEARGNLVLGHNDHTAGTRLPLGYEMAETVQDAMDRLQAKLERVDWEQMERSLEESSMMAAMSGLQAKLESVDWDEVGRKTEQAVARAMARMERKLERAQQRTERARERAERARQRAETARYQVGSVVEEVADLEVDLDADLGVHVGVEPYAEPAEDPDVLYEDERLAILHMVEDGKITPQEADMLLDALEGR